MQDGNTAQNPSVLDSFLSCLCIPHFDTAGGKALLEHWQYYFSPEITSATEACPVQLLRKGTAEDTLL